MDIANIKLKNSKKYKYLFILILVSFIISFIIFKKTSNISIINEIKNINEILKYNHINYIFMHFILIAVLLLSSLTIIGIILFPVYFVFEMISIFYNIFTFTSIFYVKGLLFSIIYVILTKAVFIFLLFLIYKKLINIYKTLFINKEDTFEIKNINIKNIRSIAFYILMIFLNDIIIYTFLNKILLRLFNFLI